MIGLVMAGGRGSRMKIKDEKLLLHYKKPVIMHVIDALNHSACFDKILAVTSPNSPKTRDYLKENNITVLETEGKGYSKDLNKVLRHVSDHVLVVSGDLPFLDGEIIRYIVSCYDPNNTWTSFVVTKKFFESLHMTSEFSVSVKNNDCIYTSLSLINAKNITNDNEIEEVYTILNEKKIAFNINTKQDYELLCTT